MSEFITSIRESLTEVERLLQIVVDANKTPEERIDSVYEILGDLTDIRDDIDENVKTICKNFKIKKSDLKAYLKGEDDKENEQKENRQEVDQSPTSAA